MVDIGVSSQELAPCESAWPAIGALMRKIILMAVAGFLWNKIRPRKAATTPTGTAAGTRRY